MRGRPGAIATSLVAAAIFALALNGGTYGLTARNSLGVALWWGIGLGAVLGLRPLSRLPRPALVGAALFAGFAVVAGLSVLWADNAEGAFSELSRLLLYLGVFLIAIVAVPRGGAGRVVDGMAVGIAAVGVLALADRCFPNVIDHGPITSDFADDPRVAYPLDYWNGLAIFIGLAYPGLLRLALAGRSAAARALAIAPLPALAATIYLTSSRGGSAAAIVGVLAFLVLADRRMGAALATAVAALGSAAAVYVVAARDELVNGPLGGDAALSQGRTAALLILLVCAATAAAWLAVARWERPLPRLSRRWKLALGIAAVAVVTAGIVAADPGRRLDSFKQPPALPGELGGTYTSSHLVSGGGNGRWQAWDGAVDEFRSAPVIGRGAGSYEAWWAQHADISYVTRYAHSLYLQTLGELGLLGFLFLAGLLATAAVTAARRWRAIPAPERGTLAAAIATLAAWAFAAGIDWVWELPVIAIVGVVLLALLVGPGTLRGVDEPDGQAPRGGRRRRLALRAAVGAASLGAIACLTIPLVARVKVQDSQRAAVRGDIAEAESAARSARDVQPWAASPYQQLALVQEQAGDLAAARRSLVRAIDRDPDSWRLWLLRARVEQEAGRPAAAKAAFDRAVALNPKSPLLTALRRQGRG